MSSPRKSDNAPSGHNTITKIWFKLLLAATLVVLGICLLSAPVRPVQASSGGSLSLGTFQSANDPIGCPGSHWFNYTDSSGNSPPVYNVYAVDNCEGPEGAPQGNVGSPTGPAGTTKIEQDMVADCTHPTQ